MNRIYFSLALLPMLFFSSFNNQAGWQEIKEQIYSFNNKVQPYRSYLNTAAKVTLATCIGLTANKFLPLKEIATKSVSVGLAGVGVYGYKYWQHNKQLNHIRRILDSSKNSTSLSLRNIEPGKTLLYSCWREKYPEKESEWPTSKDICNNETEVIKQFTAEVNKDLFPIFDFDGNKIKLNNLTTAHVIDAIENEQERLEIYLNTINDYANIAPLFVKKLCLFKHLKSVCQRNLQPQEVVFSCCPLLINEHNASVEAVITQVKNEIKNNPNHFISMPSFNPLTWTIAPLKESAVDLYGNLLKSYIRLHAIKHIAKKVKVVDGRYQPRLH